MTPNIVYVGLMWDTFYTDNFTPEQYYYISYGMRDEDN